MTVPEIEWFEVPVGRIHMGADDARAPEDERPSRLVTVRSLVVSAEPVSADLFATFVEATGHRTIAESEGSSFASADMSADLITGSDWHADQAFAVHVSWFDAVEFCRWAAVALPTEAEWAAAASAEPSLCSELWQWCADWYDPIFHRDEQRVKPVGPNSGTRRVARGGSARSTERRGLLPDHSAPDLGFRVLRN